MLHETTLIATIAVSLAFAFAGGIIAARLRLPPIVGYLLAGVVVGPFTPGFVADVKLAPQLAEIGVILLMFGIGMHFSLRDLWEVRAVALPGSIGQMVVATVMGMVAAHIWGWSFGAGLVLGLALSVASTVVLLRTLEERGRLHSVDAQTAVGWLIVEDIAIVFALILLPAIATPQGRRLVEASNPVIALGITIVKIAVFIVLMLVVGTRVAPRILRYVERTGSRDLFTLAVISMALGVAFGAKELFGVSLALGAFFAGVMINESDVTHKAAADLQPLQDAFAVLFFVAVGMLFNPTILLREPLRVLAVVGIIVVGKFLTALGIVLALRRPLSTALTIAASLAQIGELSFILAGLAVGLGLLPMEGRDLIVAGALLSITLNPLIFKIASSS